MIIIHQLDRRTLLAIDVGFVFSSDIPGIKKDFRMLYFNMSYVSLLCILSTNVTKVQDESLQNFLHFNKGFVKVSSFSELIIALSSVEYHVMFDIVYYNPDYLRLGRTFGIGGTWLTRARRNTEDEV